MSEQMTVEIESLSGRNTDEEFRFLDLLVVLARHKRLVICSTSLAGLAALIVSLLMTPVFMSSAKIMPPQQPQSSGMAAMLGQLGGLAAVAGAGGLKGPADLYVGLLESRTVSDHLISRFKLQDRYQTTMQGARDALRSSSQISIGKEDGMIQVAVTEKDPQFAADLANGYVDELAKLTQTMALSEASQRRLFFEKQLIAVKDQLATAEIALRKTQERTGLIQPAGQVQAIISNAAQLKGTIAAKEVELNAMRTFAAGKNPELLRAQEELRALQTQLSKLENEQPSRSSGFMVPTGKLPEAGTEYVRSVRDVKYYETIFELLAKQFELAKIDEAKNSSLIQLLDKAIPAEHKSKPKRALITVVGLIFGFTLGILLAFIREAYFNSLQNPENRLRLQQLAAAWKRR